MLSSTTSILSSLFYYSVLTFLWALGNYDFPSNLISDSEDETAAIYIWNIIILL